MLTNINDILIVDIAEIHSIECRNEHGVCRLTGDIDRIIIIYRTNVPQAIFEGRYAKEIAQFFLDYTKQQLSMEL